MGRRPGDPANVERSRLDRLEDNIDVEGWEGRRGVHFCDRLRKLCFGFFAFESGRWMVNEPEWHGGKLADTLQYASIWINLLGILGCALMLAELKIIH